MTDKLLESIIEGIKDKKGENISILDLRGIDGSLCDYFVICDANNTTQTEAIADSIWDRVHDDLGEKPIHDEGRQNGVWILLDYHDVIIHIFHRPTRHFYSIETLWNDAVRTDIENED
ncbi:MAG: ribosome silencing factor [Marinilabiliaceae bacterium]|nr:ribosome silencing factor [Marinilabiliaceae bacterium]